MSEAVLFHNSNTLEFEEVRHQVLRIPEVIAEIRNAQEIWDKSGNTSLDLIAHLHSDDAVFFQSGSVKEMILGVVQIGLFKRFAAKHGQPKYLVGDTKNVSPVMVAAGLIPLEDMILGSRASTVVETDSESGLPTLRGQLLPQIKIFVMDETSKKYTAITKTEMVASRSLRILTEEFHVHTVVAIGPGTFTIPEAEKVGFLEDLVCHESIDLDPLLSWFWPRVRELTATA